MSKVTPVAELPESLLVTPVIQAVKESQEEDDYSETFSDQK